MRTSLTCLVSVLIMLFLAPAVFATPTGPGGVLYIAGATGTSFSTATAASLVTVQFDSNWNAVAQNLQTNAMPAKYFNNGDSSNTHYVVGAGLAVTGTPDANGYATVTMPVCQSSTGNPFALMQVNATSAGNVGYTQAGAAIPLGTSTWPNTQFGYMLYDATGGFTGTPNSYVMNGSSTYTKFEVGTVSGGAFNFGTAPTYNYIAPAMTGGATTFKLNSSNYETIAENKIWIESGTGGALYRFVNNGNGTYSGGQFFAGPGFGYSPITVGQTFDTNGVAHDTVFGLEYISSAYAGVGELVDSGNGTATSVQTILPANQDTNIITSGSPATYKGQVGLTFVQGTSTTDSFLIVKDSDTQSVDILAITPGGALDGTPLRVDLSTSGLFASGNYMNELAFEPAPEPATMGLLVLGGVGALLRRRR